LQLIILYATIQYVVDLSTIMYLFLQLKIFHEWLIRFFLFQAERFQQADIEYWMYAHLWRQFQIIDLSTQMLQNFIQFISFDFKFLEKLLDSNVLDIQSHQLINKIYFSKVFFIMLSCVINVYLCKSVAKILVQFFHSCYIVCDWLWFLWMILDTELHSWVSFCDCKEWCYWCCNMNIVIVEELSYDKKMNSIILNIIAVCLKISLENLILSFNLIINARMKCNAKFSLDQKMIAQRRSKVWCKYEISVKDYIIRSLMISNYFVKKEINQIENNHCLSSRNVVRHLKKMIDYNHNAVVEDIWDVCAVRKINDEVHDDAFSYSSRNEQTIQKFSDSVM